MNDQIVNKTSAAFGTVAFTLLAFGSWIMGARVLAALIRGVEGFVVFGLLAWCVCKLLQAKWNSISANPPEEEAEVGQNLDETA